MCVYVSVWVCMVYDCVFGCVLWTEETDNVAVWKEEAAWEIISTALIIRGIS